MLIMDAAHWAQLTQVQAQVSQEIRYVHPAEVAGGSFLWEAATKQGDCKGIAMAKRQRLLDLGWPPQALRIALVRTEKGEMHAVLTVDSTSLSGQAGTYVLDNRFVDVEPWQALTGYTWISRQSGATWVVTNPPVVTMVATVKAQGPAPVELAAPIQPIAPIELAAN